jgi:hypothetical protein
MPNNFPVIDQEGIDEDTFEFNTQPRKPQILNQTVKEQIQ